MYSIKNFKTFRGHEGEPCGQGTLHGPAGKVADWSDDSHGGCMRIDFVNTTERAKFADWARSYVPAFKDYAGEPYDPSKMSDMDLIETAVSQMSYALEEEKELLKQCKKGIAYFRADAKAPDGRALYVWQAAYTADNVAALRAKHADLMEVVNEKLGLPFVDAATFDLAAKNKRFKQLCRSATLFTLREGDGTLKEMRAPRPYSAAVATALRDKYPNLVEIINERYL